MAVDAGAMVTVFRGLARRLVFDWTARDDMIRRPVEGVSRGMILAILLKVPVSAIRIGPDFPDQTGLLARNSKV